MSLGHSLMTWMTTLLAVIFLIPSVRAMACNETAPNNCTFKDGYCQWTHPNFSRSGDKYAHLTRGKRSGNLQSRLACATGLEAHCLKFQFWGERNGTYTLSVILKFAVGGRKVLGRFNSTSVEKWRNVSVPVVSNSTFTIIIRARRTRRFLYRQNETIHVCVRNIVYVRSACKTMPLTTAPPTHTTTNRPTMTARTTSTTKAATAKTTTKTTTSTLMTTRTSSSTTSSERSHTTLYSAFTTALSPLYSPPAVTPGHLSTVVHNAPSHDTPNATPRTSNSSALDGGSGTAISSDVVATIIGVIVALCIVFIVGGLAFIFIRQKRFTLCKAWLGERNKDSENFKACQNEAYDLETEMVANNVNNEQLDTSDVRPSYVNCSDIATSRLSRLPVNEYSVIRDSDNDNWLSAFKPLTSLYSLAQASPENTDAPNHVESPYEINNDRANPQRPLESTRNGEYTKLVFDGKGRDELGSTSDFHTQYTLLGSSEALSVHGESEATGVYHDLEEQSPSQAPRQGEGGACHVKEGTPAVERHGRVAGAHHGLGQESTAQTSGQAREEEGSGQTLPQTPSDISDHPTATSDHLVLEEDSTSLTPQQAGGELYHIHEEPPPENTNVAEESLYHVLENDFAAQGPGHGGGALYYNIEEAPTMEVQGRDRGVYHVLETDSAGESSLSGTQCRLEEFHDPDTELSDLSAAEYSSLDFDGRSSVQGRSDEATDYVYSHLHEGDEDVYNEVDRQKRSEVIDGDYSHIQLKF